MSRLLSLSLFAFSLFFYSSSNALPEDFEQEATILADSAQFDRKQGIVIYTGNVEFTQGTLRIDSDKLTVYGNDEQMEKAIAEGTPARYQQQIQADSPLTHAQALTIEYYAEQQQALLIGQAVLSQEGNEMTGERIHYDMVNETVQAGQDGDKPTRIKVTIQPQSMPNKGDK